MSRILVPLDNDWYDELNSIAYYGETELERWIKTHVQSVFPDFDVFPFKKDVISKRGDEYERPDLAMVRKDYGEWWIVEVELAAHSLGHVMEQTTVFVDGDYNPTETAEYMREQIRRELRKRADFKKLKGLVRSKSPKVLVIVDEDIQDWKANLAKNNVKLCVFEIYKSLKSHHVFRVFGEYPVTEEGGAHCRPLPQPPNVLEVIGRSSLSDLSKKKEIDVTYEEQLTRWAVIHDKGKRFLRFLGRVNPLSPVGTYSLFFDSTGKYHFRRS